MPDTLAHISTDDPVLLLVHEPDIFPRVPARVALTLAGHTHGGQIRLPLIWPAFVPSKYGARFAYGHMVEDDRHMIVSGGLGTSIIPARLGVPPEIVHVDAWRLTQRLSVAKANGAGEASAAGVIQVCSGPPLIGLSGFGVRIRCMLALNGALSLCGASTTTIVPSLT